MPIEFTKVADWVYHVQATTEYGSAVVEVTIPAAYLEQFPEGQREVEALNAAASIIWDIQGKMIDVANGEDGNAHRT